MQLVTEEHSGKCEHCHSAVPLQATVCTGCGAHWGLVNGRSRQEHYDQFKTQWTITKSLAIILIFSSICAYSLVEGALKFSEVPTLIIVIGSPIGAFFVMGMLAITGPQIRGAKKGKVRWWRK